MSSALLHSIAGAIGGVVSQTITYPLLTLSSKQQNNRENASAKQSSMLQLGYKIVKAEGFFAGLYGGYQAAMFGILVSQGVFYYCYQLFTQVIIRIRKVTSTNQLSVMDNLIVSLLSGVVTATVTNPIWVVNTRMQIAKSKSKTQSSQQTSTDITDQRKSVVETLKEVIAESGIKGLFSGLVPALILVSNPVIQFVLTERIKISLEQLLSRMPQRLAVFLLGAVTKLAASFTTYPYIVIKTRLQAKQSALDEAARLNGTVDAILKTFNNEGIAGFYKGLSSKLLHSVLSSAILFLVKDEVVALLTKATGIR